MPDHFIDRRYAELAEELSHLRRRLDIEQRRADLAEASARRAWQLATWGGARRDRESAHADGRS